MDRCQGRAGHNSVPALGSQTPVRLGWQRALLCASRAQHQPGPLGCSPAPGNGSRNAKNPTQTVLHHTERDFLPELALLVFAVMLSQENSGFWGARGMPAVGRAPGAGHSCWSPGWSLCARVGEAQRGQPQLPTGTLQKLSSPAALVPLRDTGAITAPPIRTGAQLSPPRPSW